MLSHVAVAPLTTLLAEVDAAVCTALKPSDVLVAAADAWRGESTHVKQVSAAEVLLMWLTLRTSVEQAKLENWQVIVGKYGRKLFLPSFTLEGSIARRALAVEWQAARSAWHS